MSYTIHTQPCYGVAGKKAGETVPSKENKAIKWFSVLQNRFIKAEVTSSAAVVAYYLLLSLFPLLIALGSIFSFFSIAPASVLAYLHVIVPVSVQPVLDPIVVSLLTTGSGGMFSLSALGMMWAVSRGILYLQKGMNKAYGLVPKRGLVVSNILSLVMVVMLLVVMIGFVLIFSVGQVVLQKLSESFLWAGQLSVYLNDVKWPISVLAIFCLLMLIYRFTPNVRLRLRDVWPGSLVGLVGLLLLSQMFTVYLYFSSQKFSSYGALATFIALMLWLDFSAVVLLFGAILNAALYELHYGKAKPQTGKLDRYLNPKLDALLHKVGLGWLAAPHEDGEKRPGSKENKDV